MKHHIFGDNTPCATVCKGVEITMICFLHSTTRFSPPDSSMSNKSNTELSTSIAVGLVNHSLVVSLELCFQFSNYSRVSTCCEQNRSLLFEVLMTISNLPPKLVRAPDPSTLCPLDAAPLAQQVSCTILLTHSDHFVPVVL